ncbi:MAG: valine--tRNA ligase [Actinomycetota bacterium]|nr:valine--tRNA ligase [Actinomycetota bacterium]
MAGVPEKPTLDGLEARWQERWEADGTYRFDATKTRAEVFSIDTPPPTVSGSLHMGSVFGYVQTDCLARFRRMAGAEVFYPMGWDDNGLPTERRVENFYGVRCDPSLPHDPTFEPPAKPDPKRPVPCSRPSFVELCLRLTAEDEQVFEALWRRIGLSVDWSLTYTTIGPVAQRASQRAFLRNLARGEAYAAEAPTLWDVSFQTAVAQAELEDREQPGAYHRYGFRPTDGGDPVLIETTRPELLPACVALVCHPDDERYTALVGRTVTSPLFEVEVPVHSHELAQPDKGSGIAMVCTFGDLTDVIWWRELDLPVRNILERDGRLRAEAPDAVASEAGRRAYAELAGKNAKQARARIVELLDDAGALDGPPRPITHPVKFYEKGDRPLEVVTSRQWYLRNGGRDATLRSDLLARGAELRWHPGFMRSRYESWVAGLNGDWLISRQRFFGVPFPLWYRVGDDGRVNRVDPIVPDEATLPMDPSSDVPPGYTADQRGAPGGFVGDPDIMDTWATSSLTPQIACGWEDDPDRFARTFPMDLRPQGPEIIRTWLFATMVRAHHEHGTAPWTDASINGWILDPDRKKMSKSKGNVVTPVDLLDRHGSDAVRYWAASARPGTDTAFDEGQMKVGRRLGIKLLNASKFVLGLGAGGADVDPTAVTEPLDRALLAGLADLVDEATSAFEGYDYARALERTETFFWTFCDDAVELVKGRAYGSLGPEPAASASAALRLTLSTLHCLFAPFLPFVAEEVWSWWQEGSVHRAGWPVADELRAAAGAADPLVLEVATVALTEVRKAKTTAKRSLRTEVEAAVIADTPERIAALRLAAPDLAESGRIADLQLVELGAGGTPTCTVTLAAPEEPAA